MAIIILRMFVAHILLILLSIFRAGHALPVGTSTSTNTAIVPVLGVIDFKAEPRSLLGVAWNCILTVFICAWTSVHPNVPPRGPMGGLLARIKLMFWTVVAPELVLAWAVRQWFAAREIRDIYNQQMGHRPLTQCTMAHGHFLQMGGFMLASDKMRQLKEPVQPEWISTIGSEWRSYSEYIAQREQCQRGNRILTFGRFKELVRDPKIEFSITHAQIKDRSKGDGLSKLLAILQTSWFILQCVARGVQGLALTELELVTLAMASLNAITFAFWWSKPLSVQEPVYVYVTGPAGVAAADEEVKRTESVEVVACGARDVINRTWHQPFWIHWYTILLPFAPPAALLHEVTYPVFLLFPLGILFLLWAIKAEKVETATSDDSDTVAARVVLALRKLRYRLTHSIRRYFGGKYGPLRSIVFKHTSVFPIAWFFVVPASFFFLVLLLLLLSPLFAIFFTASFIFTSTFEIVTTNKVPPGSTHVPAFYAPRTKSDKYSRMIIFAIFGAIFGGIHCIAWNFTFPTRPEKALWRYTSLVLTAIPLVVAPIDYTLVNVKMSGTVGRNLDSRRSRWR